MASESSSQNQPKQLTHASNVHFEVEDGIINFNNRIALLESQNTSYHLMLYENYVSVPPKETMKAGLATLGLFDEKHPQLSSSDLINSSPGSNDQLNVNQQTIAYCLCWGLEIDIAEILFSDLIVSLHPTTGKKERKTNIYYTRYLSLIIEHLLKDAYKNDDLMVVNSDDTAEKSSSRTSIQRVIQPKAPTDLKPKKNRIPPSSQPKSSHKVREILQKKQVTETLRTEEIVATADAT
ncbi:hypothetical protein Tco_1309552 [Tanacetum coccineum]